MGQELLWNRRVGQELPPHEAVSGKSEGAERLPQRKSRGTQVDTKGVTPSKAWEDRGRTSAFLQYLMGTIDRRDVCESHLIM